MAKEFVYIPGVCLKSGCRRRTDKGVLCSKCAAAGRRRSVQVARERAGEDRWLFLKDGTVLDKDDEWPEYGVP